MKNINYRNDSIAIRTFKAENKSLFKASHPQATKFQQQNLLEAKIQFESYLNNNIVNNFSYITPNSTILIKKRQSNNPSSLLATLR